MPRWCSWSPMSGSWRLLRILVQPVRFLSSLPSMLEISLSDKLHCPWASEVTPVHEQKQYTEGLAASCLYSIGTSQARSHHEPLPCCLHQASHPLSAAHAESAAILVEDIPLEAGSWEAEQVATLQNELQALNEAAHQEQLQRGTAAEAGLVSRAAELQDELSSLGDAAAEEGQADSAQVDLLRSEAHDSGEGEMSLMDLGTERAAKKQAAAKGKAHKGAKSAVRAKSGTKKAGKAKGRAAKQGAASAQKASRKEKKPIRSDPLETPGDGDYEGS